MLRITKVRNTPQSITLQLEGRLAGPWVQALDICWQDTLALQDKPVVHVDLGGVTFVDERGKQELAAMHREGAEFIAPDCLTKGIIAEIMGGMGA